MVIISSILLLVTVIEHVTLNHKAKTNFKHLEQHCCTYKPKYVGSLLFNGRLCRANVNYGCFLTMNLSEKSFGKIPENLKVSL